MKKVLFIDSDSPYGHVAFNSIYIRELLKINEIELNTVFRTGYIDNHEPTLSIPDYFYPSKNRGGFINRIFMIIRLFYVRYKINFKEYDYIIFSSFDEIAFYFSRIKEKCYLVVHHNVKALNSRIKGYFLKKISKKHDFIVLDEYIKEYFVKYRIKNVRVINHGLPLPYTTPSINIESLISLNKIDLKNFDKIIFSPSSNSSDNDFIAKLILNDEFKNFLKRQKILFIIKSKNILKSSKNIYVINNYLSDEEYQALFYYSSIVLIAYPKTFNYRVSNVVQECIANNKSCIMSDIESFRAYTPYLEHDLFFDSIDSLILRIKDVLKIKNIKLYKNTEHMKPDFLKLFNL